MRVLIKYLLIAIVGGVLGYQALITFLPQVIYKVAKSKMATNGAVENKLSYVEIPNESARSVVMPNPDFLYVACHYNLSNGSMQLTGDLPDSTYWSVALYQPNTINWYIKNDMEYGTSDLNLIIGQPGSRISNDRIETVEAPEENGFLLIRILVTDTSPEQLAKYKEWQHSIQFKAI